MFSETKIAKLLEMRSLFPLYIILEVGKQQDLGNKFYQTVGDALIKENRGSNKHGSHSLVIMLQLIDFSCHNKLFRPCFGKGLVGFFKKCFLE